MSASAAENEYHFAEPLRTADAAALQGAQRQFRSRRVQRVFRGVVVSSTTQLTILVRTRAALLIHPEAAHASHTTAAALYGLPVPDDPDIHVTVQDQMERRSRPGLRAHVREAGSTCEVVHGVRVSAPLQLFTELAAALPLVDAVVAGDAMLSRRLVTMDDLRGHCLRARGRHSRTARRVLSYVRRGVDSPMETRARMLIVLAGLPEPEVNIVIRDASGGILRRIDMGYEKARVMVEYDGRHHIERIDQWESDLNRREEFDNEEWRTVVITAAGIYKEPERTLRRVQRVLRARGIPVGRIDEAWRAHFRPR